LIVLSGFKYYDVEYGDMIPVSDALFMFWVRKTYVDTFKK
jgi:hypothetical protein